jgi:hypothetical protein
MVVQTVGEEVHVTVTEYGWRRWFKNVVQKCWDKIKVVGLKIASRAAGMLMRGSAPAIAGCTLALMACC